MAKEEDNVKKNYMSAKFKPFTHGAHNIFSYPHRRDILLVRLSIHLSLRTEECSLTLYVYCPVWRETRRFVPPRKFMSPEGEKKIIYYTESCSTTLYSAERCAVRHDRETRRLEGNTTICSPEAFTFLMENIYVQFGDMVYQQIVGIPMGTNCAPLIADLFLYCYERDFMSNLQKSKRFDLIDKFNDTSRYLDDIFTIDNPEFAEHIPDIYPRELQLNKANTSDKETSFLDLNIKVVGSNIHTSVYDKRDDFGFPIVNFPWLSGDVPRLPSYGIYISQLVRFARCCTSVFDFHSKNLQITSKLLTQGYRYHKLRKTFGKFFRSYSELLSKFGEISFQDYLSQGIAHPVFYGDLVYKLRRVKGESNFISSGSKIVKRLRRRQYDPAIIERTIGLVLGPFTALYRSFLKRCTLTNKAVGTI